MDLITAAGKAHLTYDEALSTMGVTGKESADELKRIFRDKMRKMHPDLPENRGQDMTQKALDLNTAYDILRGEARPAAYDFRGPPVKEQPQEPSGPSPWGRYNEPPRRTEWKEPEKVRRTFEEARQVGGVPQSGIDWKFVTTSQRGKGWMSDESSQSKNAWVAYGLYKDQHFFAVASHYSRSSYYVGGGEDTDMWWVEFRMFQVKQDEGNDPTWLARQVNQTLNILKGEFAVDVRFNGKVYDAQGWKFHEKMPVGGRELSIKNWLVNHAGVSAEAPEVASRRQTVELEFESDRFSRTGAKPGFYPVPQRGSNDYNYSQGRYTGDYWKFTLVLNGKSYELGEHDTQKILTAKLGGKRLVNAIFGEYTYDKGKKVLTRLAKGKPLLKWMAESLTGLPLEATSILLQAEAQLKGRAAA